MNAIDVVRNELACLGLHPGARHPNVADSTPVQDEDSMLFYDYWTFGNPTVIKTSETGRLLEAAAYTSARNGDDIEAAAVASRRSSIPPEMLGKSVPHAVVHQVPPIIPIRWIPASTIHQTEGRSL